MNLDLRYLFRVALQWWWLLLLGPLIAGATAYASSSRQQDLYAANARLLINPAQSTGSLDTYYNIVTGQTLAETYRQLITTLPVMEQVVADLQLPYGPDELRDKVTATLVRSTLLIEISVSDPNPELAALIANAIADRFAVFIADQAIELSSSSRAALDQQITDTKDQIDETTAQIESLEQSPDAAGTAVQSQLESLRTSRNQLQQTYLALLVTAQEMDLNAAAAKAQVTVSEHATIPESPYAPRTMLYTILAAFVGLLIAIGAAALLEYVDNTVKAGADFTALAGGPLLAAINTVPKLRSGRDQLFVLDEPNGSAAESVRLLRTNIEFAATTREIASLAITSPGPQEGKSTITANLAVTMAQAGFSVVIVDADLRRPRQHQIFGVGNDRGLTTLLTHPSQPWRWAAVDVAISDLNLLLIPSGPVPPNPADLLSLDRFRERLKEIIDAVDVVLIDTPPVLAVSDPLVIATNVDAVALVCRSGRTRTDSLKRSADLLRQGAIRIAGIVLNQQVGGDAAGYYYYGYSNYSSSDDSHRERRRTPAAAASQIVVNGQEHDRLSGSLSPQPSRPVTMSTRSRTPVPRPIRPAAHLRATPRSKRDPDANNHTAP